LQLADSQQLRLKRLYPSAHYRATNVDGAIPISASGFWRWGAAEFVILNSLPMVAGLVLALDGKPQEGIDINEVRRYTGDE